MQLKSTQKRSENVGSKWPVFHHYGRQNKKRNEINPETVSVVAAAAEQQQLKEPPIHIIISSRYFFSGVVDSNPDFNSSAAVEVLRVNSTRLQFL